MPQNWVARVVDEERLRDQTHSREVASARHHADVVPFHLDCLMLVLKNRVARDVEAFARELPERRVSFEECAFVEGFSVRRDSYPEAHMTDTPNPQDGSIRVQSFASADGLSAPRLMELVPDGEQRFAVHRRDHWKQAFGTIEQLSEYLLVPLFTGDSR